MKIVCISDTHCNLRKIKLPKGDMIIHAGDALSHGTYEEWVKFSRDYAKLNFKYKIYVPGNHDRVTEQNEDLIRRECAELNIIYLNDTGITIEGVKIWGSAITPRFHNWAWNRDSKTCGTSYHSDSKYFQSIEPHWELIPDDTDILVTHGPPHGIMDRSIYSGALCGCKYLLEKVKQIEPKYHIYGHIHQWHGKLVVGKTTFVNAANCTEEYKPTNEPIIIDI